jgi:anti-sigma B factor antagonist
VSSPVEPVRAASAGVGPLQVEHTTHGGVAALTFTGDLDIATLAEAEEAVAAVEQAGPAAVVIDLSGLGFLDSSGVRLVLQADARAREAGRRLAVVLGHGRSLRLFEVLGLVHRLDVVESREAVPER